MKTAEGGAFRLPVRVYYEDTDAAGVVYYASYLRFLERARSDWLRAQGLDVARLAQQGVVFAVRRVEIDYLQPARLSDLLEVSVQPAALGRASVTVHQEVYRDGELLSRACVRLACLDAERLTPRPLPPDIQGRLTPCPISP